MNKTEGNHRHTKSLFQVFNMVIKTQTNDHCTVLRIHGESPPSHLTVLEAA